MQSEIPLPHPDPSTLGKGQGNGDVAGAVQGLGSARGMKMLTSTGPSTHPWHRSGYFSDDGTGRNTGETALISGAGGEPICSMYRGNPDTGHNGRLILSACNAMQSAATRLGVDPVELAEALADGGVAELVEGLRDIVGSCQKSGVAIVDLSRGRQALARIPARKGGG